MGDRLGNKLGNEVTANSHFTNLAQNTPLSQSFFRYTEKLLNIYLNFSIYRNIMVLMNIIRSVYLIVYNKVRNLG